MISLRLCRNTETCLVDSSLANHEDGSIPRGVSGETFNPCRLQGVDYSQAARLATTLRWLNLFPLNNVNTNHVSLLLILKNEDPFVFSLLFANSRMKRILKQCVV